MSEAASWVLRVLEGQHKGAGVPLAAFPQGLQIAAAGDADVLLRDAPGRAWLLTAEDALQWQEDEFSQPLQPGMVWRWGQLVLGLARLNEPWPSVLPVPAFDRQPAQAPSTPAKADPAPDVAAEAADDMASAAVAAPSADAPPAEPAPRASGQRRKASRWTAARTVVVLALVIGVVLIGLGLGTRMVAGRTDKAQVTPPTPSDAGAARINLRQVRQLLVNLSLEMMVVPDLRPDGRLVLKGVVADDDQLEALATELRRITDNASVLVITQAEFVARVKTLQPNLPQGIRANAQDNGQLLLEATEDTVDWALARQLVQGELPEIVLVNQVVVSALAPQPAPALASNPRSAPPTRTAAFPALPGIVAVVGGAQPYLLLAAGQKWLTGGKIDGLTLKAVEEQNLVFEDAQGQTWRRPR